MKCVLFASLCVLAGATAGSPVDQVVGLIKKLKTTTETDGKNELKAYDKYACWCEDTLGEKASAISKAKTQIEELQTLITKLGGELASYSIDIKQLEKDVAANKQSRKEAEEMRDKEYKGYDEDKTQGEQCIGALEAAIKVLTGAGAKKGKFLQTIQEAELLSTLGALRGVMGTSVVRKTVSDSNLNLVRNFINSPDDYFNTKAGTIELQTANNPFGDYAPQSSAIQGILKGMYDTFTMDLEKSNAEESNKQKAYEALMATKIAEGNALEATLQSNEKTSAEKTKEHADSKKDLDDTNEQLDADEQFFAQTKQSCKEKSQAWAERVRLRAEELQGMATAVSILTSDEAKATFKGATTTFLQLKAAPSQSKAYDHVRQLAVKVGGTALAQVAAQVRLSETGHFDKIIHAIQNMVIKLKEEAKDDIEHRDRCETKQAANKKATEDLEFNIKKLGEKLGRMDDTKKSLDKQIADDTKAIAASDKDIKTMKKNRAEEWDDFNQATKDDVQAVALLGQAIASLSKFYKDNKIKQTNLLQVQGKPPGTWEDDEYGGKKSESGGILAILSMIKDDLESELKAGKQGDAAAQINFKNDLEAMQSTMDAQMASKADADKKLAAIERQVVFKKDDKSDLGDDLDGEGDIEKALKKDCDWIKKDFAKRKSQRVLEIEGLNEAAQFLAGAVILPR